MMVMPRMRASRDTSGMITVLTSSKSTHLHYSSFSVCELGSRFALFELNGLLVEHDNAYVRSSAAVAFTEAVERWPLSVIETIYALLHLYHEKVAHRTSWCIGS